MLQNRKAPAYMEYAASMMANSVYRSTSPAERGLLYAMRLECWENGGAPNNPEKLARIFGFTKDEISQYLPAIMPLFLVSDGFITCPELDNYREHIDYIRLKKSEGGKASANKAKENRGKIAGKIAGSYADDSVATEKQLLSKVKYSKAKSSTVFREGNIPIDDPWVNDYQTASQGE